MGSKTSATRHPRVWRQPNREQEVSQDVGTAPEGTGSKGKVGHLQSFHRNLSLLSLLLLGASWAASQIITDFSIAPSIFGWALMAGNTYLAVAMLHRFQTREPLQVYLLSMAGRLVLVGAVVLAWNFMAQPSAAEAYSFLFSAMIGFIVFQALEVKHLIKHQAALFGNR